MQIRDLEALRKPHFWKRCCLKRLQVRATSDSSETQGGLFAKSLQLVGALTSLTLLQCKAGKGNLPCILHMAVTVQS